MTARSIKVWNATTSQWEDVAVAAPDASALIPKSLIGASKGAIVTSTGSAVVAQAVGSDGHALIADSTQANGMRWGSVTTSGEDDQIVLAVQVFG
jgi:hypothetical protein